TVLFPTLTIHVFPSYANFVVGPSFGGVFSSTTIRPAFSSETVTHLPRSGARSSLAGASSAEAAAAISSPVLRIKRKPVFMTNLPGENRGDCERSGGARWG